MNNFPDKMIVDAVKAAYPRGCRVVLDQMNDEYREMPAGLKGTVEHVDDTGTVFVSWENGSSLGVVYGVDRLHREYANTRIKYLYRDASNYKTWNEVTVKGQFTKDQINEILDCCENHEYFIPEQIGWDLLRGWDVTEDDHCYGELNEENFEPTDKPVTLDISVDDVLKLFRDSKDKWDAAKYAPEVEPRDDDDE